MGNARNKSYSRKKKFRGNRYTKNVENENESNGDKAIPTSSESKLNFMSSADDLENDKGNAIFNIEILNEAISFLCCPVCFKSGINLIQESVFGLALNMSMKCANCNYLISFCTSAKVNKLHNINIAFVFGMRLLGRGYSAANKLCSAINVKCPSKTSYRLLERKLECAAEKIANEKMNDAALEIRVDKNQDEIVDCGVSVDGSWQRRGHSSLNGCVTAISIDTGKVLDIEVMSKMCRSCKIKNDETHECKKHIGTSGSMEPTGVYRIFERSSILRNLRYIHFYGDGDSKGYETVKDIYGENSVTKYECIGHIQKRVGSRLRKLKTQQKGLGGRGKLTDLFIDKLQNYYGIAIRSNVNDLQGMQRAVIAAFFHCCSSAKDPMHEQCPKGPNSWCRFQKAVSNGKTYKDKSQGLPQHIINVVKPVYMKLCDQTLLSKCLHGKTQNANESFNGILWKYVPKEIFVELQTLKLGAWMAVIQFNAGFQGLLDVLKVLGFYPGVNVCKKFQELDKERIVESRRHSLPNAKVARKINKQNKKRKLAKAEQKEGITYKCGEF